MCAVQDMHPQLRNGRAARPTCQPPDRRQPAGLPSTKTETQRRYSTARTHSDACNVIYPSIHPSDSTGSGNLDEDPRQAMPVPPVRRAAGQSSASDEGDHRPLQEADTINLTEEETDTDVNEEDGDNKSDKKLLQLNGRLVARVAGWQAGDSTKPGQKHMYIYMAWTVLYCVVLCRVVCRSVADNGDG